MYHEFYPQIFTKLGFPCDPYDGSYRWNGKKPSATIVAAVEKLPTDQAFRDLDLSTNKNAQALKALLSTEQWAVLTVFQREFRQKARVERYKTEADPLLMEALYDSVRDDGKGKALAQSAWAEAVTKIKAELPL